MYLEIVKDKEGERILSKISPDAHVIALAIEGKMKSSEELADNMDRLFSSARFRTASLKPSEPPMTKVTLLFPYVASLSILSANSSELFINEKFGRISR